MGQPVRQASALAHKGACATSQEWKLWNGGCTRYVVDLQEFMAIIPLIVCVTGFCMSLLMHRASDKLGRKVVSLRRCLVYHFVTCLFVTTSLFVNNITGKPLHCRHDTFRINGQRLCDHAIKCHQVAAPCSGARCEV